EVKQIHAENFLEPVRKRNLILVSKPQQLPGGRVDDRDFVFFVGEQHPVVHRFEHQLDPTLGFVLRLAKALNRVGGLVGQRVQQLPSLRGVGVDVAGKQREPPHEVAAANQRNAQLAGKVGSTAPSSRGVPVTRVINRSSLSGKPD